jgi:hypothetical protein
MGFCKHWHEIRRASTQRNTPRNTQPTRCTQQTHDELLLLLLLLLLDDDDDELLDEELEDEDEDEELL